MIKSIGTDDGFVVNAMYGYGRTNHSGDDHIRLIKDCLKWDDPRDIYSANVSQRPVKYKPCCNCGAPKLVSLCEYCRT